MPSSYLYICYRLRKKSPEVDGRVFDKELIEELEEEAELATEGADNDNLNLVNNFIFV